MGVQARLKGAVVLVPTGVASTRYCTLVIEPTGVDVVAVSVVATLTGTVEPAVGDEMATVGAKEVVTVMATPALVLMLPAKSVARAVSE